ncbi:hypothetical protein GYB22_01315 [bacterium]|nr:hypothetical protein [bacterium]
MRTIVIVLLFGFIAACSSEQEQEQKSNEQEITENESTSYPFPTDLEGGFNIKYSTSADSSGAKQKLTLYKNETEVRVLSETRKEAKSETLGYIEQEFAESFLFVQKFGEERPIYFRIIEKESGEEIKKGILVDHKKEEQVILYLPQTGENRNNLRLFDIKNNKDQGIGKFLEEECGPYPTASQCVGISSIDENEVIISYKYAWDETLQSVKR